MNNNNNNKQKQNNNRQGEKNKTRQESKQLTKLLEFWFEVFFGDFINCSKKGEGEVKGSLEQFELKKKNFWKTK